MLSKKLSKYISVFDYFGKTLIVLSSTSGGMPTVSFTSINGAPVGIASASFTLAFSLITGIIKKLERTRNKKKEHSKIHMLAKRKINNIKTLTSQALIDLEISHEEFKQLLMKKKSMKNERKY